MTALQFPQKQNSEKRMSHYPQGKKKNNVSLVRM